MSWLVHQHRAAYELAGTIYSDFGHDERDVGLKDTAPRPRRADARRVRGPLHHLAHRQRAACAASTGCESTPLYHPPLLAPRLAPGPSAGYVLSVARLEGNKRVDLLVRAMAHVPEPVTLVLVGEGSHRQLIEQAAEEAGVAARVRFAGAVHDNRLVTLYREALALAYVPFDEDYGLATLEAFLAAKPVVTADDSGRHARVRRRTR